MKKTNQPPKAAVQPPLNLASTKGVGTGNARPKTPDERAAIMRRVCASLEEGTTLKVAVAAAGDPVAKETILDWVDRYPELEQLYSRARAQGYRQLADQIQEISDETDVKVRYEDEDVTLALDATAVARNRLRVDTRKWILSKMLPKVYGDKVTNEHTGAGGGAIQIAALEMKGLTDEELATMRALMLKANGASS